MRKYFLLCVKAKFS